MRADGLIARALGPGAGSEETGAPRAATPGELLVRRLLTPEIGFPLLWLLGVGLAQIRLFSFQKHGDWSLRVWCVMALVPIAFVCGAAVGRAGADLVRRRVSVAREPSQRQWRQASLVLLAIGALEALHQLALTSSIPLFQADIDRSRVALSGGPTIVLTNCAPLAAALALAGPRRLDPRRYKLEFGVAIAGLCVVALFGGRGQVVLGVAVLVLLRAFRFGLPSPRFVGGAIAAIGLFVAVIFFLRTRQNAANPFESELFTSVLPDVPSPLRVLVPLHVAIASNFEALAQIVGFFPDRQGFAHGAYNAHGFDLVIPGSKHIGDVSVQLTPPFVTTTVAGPLWADGGFGWVTGGLAAIGALAGGMHRLAARTGALRYMLPSAYLTYLCVFGIYQNAFTQHPDWVVVAPLLFATGAWLDGLRPAAIRERFAYGVGVARLEVSKLRGATARGRGRLTLAGAVLLVIVASVVIGGTLGTEPGSFPANATRGEPAGTIPAPASQVVSNSDGLLDNEPLWTVRRGRRAVRLTGYAFRRGGFRRTAEVSFPARLRRTDRVDISSWFGEAHALFGLRTSQRAVEVEVWGSTARRQLSAGRADEPSLLPRGTRDVAIATYSGQLPDLFIVDRGEAEERARLAIYSGESAFRTRILRTRLPVAGLSAEDWALDIGGLAPAPPDVILVARRGASGGPELHVVAGITDYRTFKIQHRAEGLSAPPGTAVRAVTAEGSPAAAVIAGPDGAAQRLTLLRGPRPGQ